MFRRSGYTFLIVVWASFQSLTSFAAVPPKPIVFAKSIEMIELSETLTYPARIDARVRAEVVAENDGVVSRILAPLGSEVKVNTPILTIRNTDPVYQYSPMRVTSPVSGVVSRVEVTEGSRVAKGDKLVMVTGPDQVRVIVEITAQDVSSIKTGLEAELKIPGRDFEDGLKVRVRGMSPFVDPATGTATCELELAKAKEKTKQRLPPLGVIGRVVFNVNKRSGISIPDSAITYRGKEPYVRLVENGKAKLVAVKLGRKESGQVEILKGLAKGDQLVERSAGFVADGEEVEVKKVGGEEQSPKSKSDSKPPQPAGKA